MPKPLRIFFGLICFAASCVQPHFINAEALVVGNGFTNSNHPCSAILITNTFHAYPTDWNTDTLHSDNYDLYTLVDAPWKRLSLAPHALIRISPSDLTVIKSVDSVKLASADFSAPGAVITYRISYTNQGDSAATNVVIYDSLPAHTTYKTNYTGIESTGWTVQFANIARPDQCYNSLDYSSTNAGGAMWVRFIKASVPSGEGYEFLYLGVTID